MAFRPTAPNQTDYARLYFKYPIPTPIRGEPDAAALKKLKRELRANASSVESDLGGGDHGYLGLVLTDDEYKKIVPNHQFKAPSFPGALNIPSSTDPVVALGLRANHQESIRVYRECRAVEKALTRHIQGAIEPEYLDSLVNDETQLIEDDIPTVLKFLDNRYGNVDPDSVKAKEAEVLAVQFNPTDPLATVTKPIEELKMMAIDAEIPYSEEQLVSFGITIIKNSDDFEDALAKWYKKSNKTWKDFKAHFSEAQIELKKVRGPSMRQAGYRQANMLAEQVRRELATSNEEILALLQNLNQNTESPPTQPPAAQTTPPTIAPVANATISDTVQLEIVRVLKEIKQGQTQAQPQASPSQQSGGGGQPGGGRRRRRGKKTPDDAANRFSRRVTTSYCWTHGACNHNGENCFSPHRDHDPLATFEDKRGGSCAFCP